MVTKTITEQRVEVRIFAGNDPAHTATGSSGISSATPALTPLMLDEATGKLVVWDGQKAGSAVGILVSGSGKPRLMMFVRIHPVR